MSKTLSTDQVADSEGAQQGGSGRTTRDSGKDKKRRFIAVAMALIASASLASTLAAYARPPRDPPISAVGVYSSPDCKTSLSSINWGTLSPGGNKSVVAYVKNEGTVPVTLALSAANWSPTTASSYMTLSWDYNGARLNPGTKAKVTLTLQVSSSVDEITSFSFDVVITATG